MANEGSTKPTYSELEPWQAHERRLLEVMMESVAHDVDKMDAWLKLYIAARDSHTDQSLARVRGLLQRQYDLVRDEILVRNTVHDSNFATYTKQAFRLTATLRETELALAESADIGKLDSADESADLLYVRGLLWKLRNTAKGALRDAEREADAWLSAETGGEKAALRNEAFYIKRGDQYHCQFRDMILYVTNSGTEEKFAEQWCADFNKRLAEHNAEMLAEKAKELAARVWMRLTDPEPPTFPRPSQNQLDYFLVTYGFDGNNHARQMLISCWAAARQYERKQAAESSLSSPRLAAVDHKFRQ